MSADELAGVTRRSAMGLAGAALVAPVAPVQSSSMEKRRMFTPKFIDLVRNYTTTAGTADFVLGPAVNGFASFTAACQPGDCFYYSATGVDNPGETEVGRGTLVGSATISRDPIGGVKTNFSSGTKSIGLIAAAEWYAAMNAAAGAAAQAPTSAADRAALAQLPQSALPALLTERGHEGLFVWDGADHSADVLADTAKALFVAPASDPSGAAGAWVRKYSGQKDARWFGAKADGVSDDSTALQAWLDSGGHLSLPAGEYYCSRTLIVRKHVVIDGDGYGFDSRLVNNGVTVGYELQPGARIRFAAGVGGIEIQPQTTVTDVATAVTSGIAGDIQEGAMNSRIANLALIGAGTGASATGLYCRTRVDLQNVHAYKFQGKGFDISASSDVPDGNSEFGGASHSTLRGCRAIYNGSHGFHIRGRDTNVTLFESCFSQLNGGWGFVDDSELGNTYVACLAATNTTGSFKGSSLVGVQAYLGCYVETGTGYNCDLNSACQVVGGYLAQCALTNNAAPIKAQVMASEITQLNKIKFAQVWPNLGPATEAWAYRHGDQGLVLQGAPGVGGAGDITLRNKNDVAVVQIPTGSTTTRHYGEVWTDFAAFVVNGDSAFPGMIATQGRLWTTATNGLSLAGFGSSYDTTLVNHSGAVALGVPTGSTNVVAAGSLTTSSTGGIGYSAGAGGTVIQTTSKSTGVTLNKISGQVTMSGAALAAGAKASFVVTNNAVAATDVVIANVVSGGTANAYRAFVTSVAAGSFTVTVENISSGSLSEAPVIGFAVIKAVTA